MKAESTIIVSIAAGIASVCLLLTCLNMYMMNNMRTTLKNLDERQAKYESPEGFSRSAALVEEPSADPDRDELVAALYRHLDYQNNQIAQYENKLQHLAELHEHRRQLLEEQEAVRQNHMNSQKMLESQKRKLARKLTKFQLEKQAHEHRKEVEEYERQLQQTFEQLHELQRLQELQHQVQPFDNTILPADDADGMVFMIHQADDLPFSPLEHFLSQIFGGGIFGAPYEEDEPVGSAVTVTLNEIKDFDSSKPDQPDFAEEPAPVDDADVLADSDDSHVVVHRVLPELDDGMSTSTTPVPVMPTPAA